MRKICSNYNKKKMMEKSKHIDPQRPQNTEQDSRKKKKEQRVYKTARKQSKSGHSLSPYLPITTVNKNRLNSPIKTKEWLNRFFKK